MFEDIQIWPWTKSQMWTSEVWEKNRSSENRSIKTANLAHLNLAVSWMRRQLWASNTAGIFKSLPVIFWPCCIPKCQLRALWVFLARQHNNFHSPYGPLIRFASCNFLHSPKITMKLKGSSFGTLDQIQWPSQTQIKWTAALQKNKNNQQSRGCTRRWPWTGQPILTWSVIRTLW